MTKRKARFLLAASSSRIAFAMVLTVALFGGWADAAADTIQRAHVISLEAGEAYVPIAPDSGVAPGHAVRFRHPIELQHPRGGDVVRDELPIGEGTVTMVATRLAMIRLDDALADVVAVGDVVEILVPSQGEPQAEEGPLEPWPEASLDVRNVTAAWRRVQGHRHEVQLAAWRRFLAANPKSSYREEVRAEIEELEASLARSPGRVKHGDPFVGGVVHEAPVVVPERQAVDLAFTIPDPESVPLAWLHFRTVGEPTYRSQELERDGDAYLRGRIAAKEVRAPGLEYFVEVARDDGRSGVAIGSANDPQRVRVHGEKQHALRETRNRSRVSMIATYLDYATFDERRDGREYRDRFALFETDFLFRLRRPWLYGVRIGMGVLGGEGGFESQAMPEQAGFQYGYSEFEFRTKETRAYLARVIAGIGNSGLAFGAEGRVRFGREEASNLSFALSSLAGVGFLSEVRMQWVAIETLPMGFSVGVTDQPNNGDLGVRLTGDIGYRALDWFSPTVRISYQGRSVQHSGLGVGLGLVFDW